MRQRYLCPKHKESTASAVVYGDRYYCFGCGAKGPIQELGLTPDMIQETQYVEDISQTTSYILGLSKRSIRGLDLFANDSGYFILWPDLSYYKFRLFNGDSPGSKYRSPTGVAYRPFVPSIAPESQVLILVEGEINAASLAASGIHATIASPGSAGNFSSKAINSLWPLIHSHQDVVVFVDNDAAGRQAAIEFAIKCRIIAKKRPITCLLDRDFNDILVKEGRDGVCNEYELQLKKAKEMVM